MYDPVFTAKSLASDWELTLGALPPAMKAAVNLFEEADYAHRPANPLRSHRGHAGQRRRQGRGPRPDPRSRGAA
jgi:hypothetical protein